MIFAAKAETLPCKVRRVWTTFKVMQTPRFNPDLAPKTLLLRFVIKSERRNAQIIAQLIQAAQAGRKVLVLSERLQHLHDMDRLFKQSWPAGTPVPSTGYYVGGMSERELDISEECQVIFATSQMTAEGLDIPAIDTLFLTTPLSDIEQAAGRIRRPSEGKKEPVIVDFIDEQVPQFKRMAETRQKFYKRMGWAD
jgi:superfamily II DNA or RNA helicase